ncbi:MAG: tyrosine-type recombinase/integrase [Thermoplasmatota archaeon]
MKWVRGGDEYPPEVRWLKATRDPQGGRMMTEVLGREELLRLIEAQAHPQDKAVIAVLYDSGCRASEFVSLRLRDIAFDEYGAILSLPKGGKGLKTGARRIRVLNCTPYLRAWINGHPRKDEPNSPVWLSFANRNQGEPLTASSLYGLVHRGGLRAKLAKHIHPHLFRHSRATECAKEGWPEAEMRNFFGWSRSSDQPSRYVHLSGKDYEESMLRRAGKIDAGRKIQPALAPRVCQCGHENAATADFCENRACGKPLTVAAAERRAKTQYATLLQALEQDGDAMDKLANALMARAQAPDRHV